MIVAIAAPLALLAGGLALGPAGAGPALARMGDALAALADRSPGERAAGAIGKVPRTQAATPPISPAVERALGKIFAPPRAPLTVLGPPLDLGPQDTLSPLALGGAPGGGQSPFGSGGGGGVPLGGGGGGVGGPGGGNPTGAPPNATSPSSQTPGGGTPAIPGEAPVNVVPEPGSWAMLSAGMGLVGAALRRRARRWRAAS